MALSSHPIIDHDDHQLGAKTLYSGGSSCGFRFVAWITGFAAALVLTPVDRSATQASNFPNRLIKIIIGPSPDIFSQIVAEHLQQTWGRPVVVEPRPGAGGKLAVTAVSTAAPDRHTLLFATPTYTLDAAMKESCSICSRSSRRSQISG